MRPYSSIGKGRQVFNACFSHDVVVFDPHAGAEDFFVVQAGSAVNTSPTSNVSFQMRIEMRRFVRKQADAVAQVMVEDADWGLVREWPGPRETAPGNSCPVWPSLRRA